MMGITVVSQVTTLSMEQAHARKADRIDLSIQISEHAMHAEAQP
jgi:hypothetical protein